MCVQKKKNWSFNWHMTLIWIYYATNMFFSPAHYMVYSLYYMATSRCCWIHPRNSWCYSSFVVVESTWKRRIWMDTSRDGIFVYRCWTYSNHLQSYPFLQSYWSIIPSLNYLLFIRIWARSILVKLYIFGQQLSMVLNWSSILLYPIRIHKMNGYMIVFHIEWI